jgi:SAM-dependent methyltransferase
MPYNKSILQEDNMEAISTVALSEHERLRDIISTKLPLPYKGLDPGLIKRYSAQIGEIGWHSVNADSSLDANSLHHANVMHDIIKRMKFERPRILEVGAYAHYSSQIAAHMSQGLSVSHDISASSLKVGQELAQQQGYGKNHHCVAGDFHNLPFEDGAFDLVYIASAVHHTIQPALVLRELARVTRPGGVLHLENEPVGRLACFYQFRCNRNGEGTPFEGALWERGMIRTFSSPFPGSRPEERFGMIENDRIPLETYERSLLQVGRPLRWDLDSYSNIGEFEAWLLKGPTEDEIIARLNENIEALSLYFSEHDEWMGFSLPSADQVWTLATQISSFCHHSSQATDPYRFNARLFGAALKASMVKAGEAPVGALLRRELREDQSGIFIDDSDQRLQGLELTNILSDQRDWKFGNDWTIHHEDNGIITLADNGAFCRLLLSNLPSGLLLLRIHSVADTSPYIISVVLGDRLAYRHNVILTESHLARVYVQSGEDVVIYHHYVDGNPVAKCFNSRIIPHFIPIEVMGDSGKSNQFTKE